MLCVWILLILVVPIEAAPKQIELPDNTTIALHRGGCEKRCAVYDVTIRANGRVTYEGQHYVRRGGRREAKIDPLVVRALIEQFYDADFFSLRARYDSSDAQACPSTLSDGPRAIIAVTVGNQFKTVIHDHKCVGPATARLTELEDSIDKAAGTSLWIK